MRVLVALGGGEHVRRVAQPLVLAIRRYTSDVSSLSPPDCRAAVDPLRGARWLSPRERQAHKLLRRAIVAGGVTLYEACALGTRVSAVVPAWRGPF
jgi:hypothetical protein